MNRTLYGVALVLVLVTSFACGSENREQDATATPEPPDRVVGVIIRCELGSGIRLAGEECTALRQAPGMVKEVTVRTASGSTYVVSIAKGDVLFDDVELGDVWPPEK